MYEHKTTLTGILTLEGLNFLCEKIDDLLHTHVHHGPCHNVLFCCDEGSKMYQNVDFFALSSVI